MTRRSGWKGSTRSFWILFSSSVLLFSPLNHDNFLWGFQIGFLLPLACVTACIWVATYVRHPLNFVFSIVLCTICTFSIASGLASWLLTTPLLMLAQARSTSSKKWWAIWILTFLFELLVYFGGYEKTTTSSFPVVARQPPNFSARVYPGLPRKPFHFRDKLAPAASRSGNERIARCGAADCAEACRAYRLGSATVTR